MATTSMNIRTDSEIKKQAEELFAEFGLNMTTAVNMFLRQAIRERSIPFELTLITPPTKKKGTINNRATLNDDEKKHRAEYLKQLNEAVALSMDEELIPVYIKIYQSKKK